MSEPRTQATRPDVCYVYPADEQISESPAKLDAALERLAAARVVVREIGGELGIACPRGWMSDARREWFAARHAALVRYLEGGMRC